MSEAASDPRAAIGAAPIPGDAPAGINIRYEPDFADLQAKVAKMDTDGPLAVNWKEVAADACNLLATRSKDLLISAWATIALAREESWGGLAIGLQITEGMIATYWPDLEPPAKRERARVQMLEWIASRTAALFEEVEPAEKDWTAVRTANASLENIESMLSEKLTKETAALGDLARLLRERSRAIEREIAARAEAEKAKAAAAAKAAEDAAARAAAEAAAKERQQADPGYQPAPATQTSSQPHGAPMAGPAVPSVAAPAGPADIDPAINHLQAGMQTVAFAIQAAAPTDPRGYVLLRAAVWLPIRGAPVHTNGTTLIPAPPTEALTAIASMQAAGNHKAALDAIEQRFVIAPFWLDGQRLAVECLKAMGDAYEPARLAVLGETAAILRRLPSLLDFRFRDESPFASPQTREWIQSDVASGAGAGAEADPNAAIAAAARQQLGSGGPKAALAVFAAAGETLTGRPRFRWLLAQAAFCLDVNLALLALALLDSLEAETVRMNLETWEPDLAVQVSVLMHRCLLQNEIQQARPLDVRTRQLEWHRGRLCRLNMVAAARALQL